MAVMSSLHQDSTTFEQKTEPGPPSDKMAVDLDINGSSNHDDSIRQSEVTMSVDNESLTIVSTSEEVNGAHNTISFSTNNTIPDSLDLPDAPTMLAEDPQKQIEPSTIPDSNMSASTPDPPTSNLVPSPPIQVTELTPEPTAPHQDPVESTSDLQVTTAASPIIEVQESNLREEVIPVSEERAAEIQAEKHELDLIADPELAAALSSGTDNIELAPDSVVAAESEVPTTSLDDHPVHPASFSNLDLNYTSQSQPSSEPPTLEPTQDADMVDAPHSPSKVIHERDEDMDDGPSAKRTKVEDSDNTAQEFAVPSAVPRAVSGTPNSSGELAITGDADDEMPPTPHQVKEMLKAIKHIKGTINGKNFVLPVAVAWPTLAESYLAKISNPIDLTTIEERVKQGYSRMADYKADVRLIYENAVSYNGVDHQVSKAGATVRDNLLGKIPGPEPPMKVEKKARKSTPVAEVAPRVPPARRQSRGANMTARSPSTTAPAPTFALDPSGTPLIRRDSMVGEGGRPKREIHPPKSRDLPYSARPKKKKFVAELKFCEEVLNEIKKAKYAQFTTPFMTPVDPVALGIPTYFSIIKTPMDVSTVTERLSTGQYDTAKDFYNDMKQIFKNCYKFNPAGNAVNVMGKQFEELFEAEWSKKAQYIADNTVSNAGSPSSTVESEEEDSEEEEVEEPVVNASSAIQARLVEEQTKLIELMKAKKPDPALVKLQQDMVDIVKKQADLEAARQAAARKPKAKAVKKSAPAKKDPKPKKGAQYRPKVVGFAEKEQISAGIGQLDAKAMEQALSLLKLDLPHMDLTQEMELDIDDVSAPTLSKLYDLIVKNVPGIVPAAPEPRARAPKPQKPKKNKPMSKTEQESKIAKLKQLEQQFDRPGSTSDDARASGGVVPSVEQDQSSGDESSSDSEED